jgi:hypothetical protein
MGMVGPAVMGNNPNEFKSPDRPIDTVSFVGTDRFIRKLNAQIPGLRLSLPSEAELEYACRAGTTEATYAGNLRHSRGRIDPILDKIAWYLVHPAGCLNPFRLLSPKSGLFRTESGGRGVNPAMAALLQRLESMAFHR